MVDLTKLSKEELIREFDLILSEWKKCEKRIKSFEREISNLGSRKSEITWEVRKQLDIAKKEKTFNVKIKKMEKACVFSEKTHSVLLSIIVVLMFLIFFAVIAYNFFHMGSILIPSLISLIVLGSLFFIFDKLITFLSGINFFNKKLKKLKNQKQNMYKELSEVINQNEERRSIEAKIKSLQGRIQGVKVKFDEFRRKRNNLASKYYGCEHLLKDYLESGRADNFKEALEKLEEDFHRQDMLNVQRNMRAQMNNMSNQLSRQSSQLSSQSAQIDNLRREIDYLSN